MDHLYIEENNIIDRYWTTDLSAVDRMRFEEHFVDCPECQDRLEASGTFSRSLEDLAAKEAWHPQWNNRSAWRGWQAGMRGRPAWIVAAAACIVLLAATVLLVRQIRSVRAELAQAKLTVTAWQRLETESREATARLSEQLRIAEQLSLDERTRRAHLEPSASTGPDRPARVPVLATILMLNSTRGVDLDTAAPINRLYLSRQPQWIVLSADRDDSLSSPGYRATLKDSRGQVAWTERLTGLSSFRSADRQSAVRAVSAGRLCLHAGGWLPGRTYRLPRHPDSRAV